MKQFRITKYDPKHRNAQGAYTRDEWTSFSDIGKSVTKEEYEEVEAAYIDTVLKSLREEGILELRIIGLEDHGSNIKANSSISEGAIIKTETLTLIIRGILREQYWAKLEAEKAFVHFGYDYYMYLGIPNVSNQVLDHAMRNGLFVEEFESPYANEL